MARNRTYDLYEGDGEEIGEEEFRPRRAALPGKRPLGRDEDLRARDRAARRAEEARAARRTEGAAAVRRGESAAPNRRRLFPEREEEDGLGRLFPDREEAEDDGLDGPDDPDDSNAGETAARRGREEPVSLFDDFDREAPPLSFRPGRRKKKRLKHPGAWAAVMALSLMGLLACAWLMIPQLTGVRFRFLPTVAFANGNLIRYDSEKYETFRACVGEIYTDAIYPGVYLDGIHVGGMTKEQALEAVNAGADMSGEDFDIVLTVGNQSWHVTPERVPVSRDTAARVEEAWSQGRGNSAGLRGTGKTPFQERIERASGLRSFPVSLKTEKTWSHDALRELCQGIANYVNRDPVNSKVATFDFGTKAFTFTEDQPGVYLDPDLIYRKTAAMLDGGDYFNTLFLTPEKVLAEVTKTELMNSFGLIASYTTDTTSNKNRNTNIRLSAEAINATTVLPGEIFSFNAATGERTAEKGYLPAAAISGGQSRDEIGGGVCQTSSTLFNAAARANLEIVERSPHAWPSSYVEKGFDATVNWPGLDFKFKNNTEWPIFILASYANRKVTASIYGMSLGVDVSIDLESVIVRELPQPEGVNYVINGELKSGESKKTVTGRKGYVVETWKIWKQNGKEIRREKMFTSTYKAYQETIEYNPY